MRIINLNEDSKNKLLEQLMKRSQQSYGQYEQTVNDIIDNVKKKKKKNIIEYKKKIEK